MILTKILLLIGLHIAINSAVKPAMLNKLLVRVILFYLVGPTYYIYNIYSGSSSTSSRSTTATTTNIK